jgi:outer membrane protein OmpA-like peptidoglycan-associated protein
MKRSLLLVASLLVGLSSSVAVAEDDCDGCKDHPQVARFPGFFLESAEQNDFNSVEFTTGDESTVKKEGKYWSLRYQQKEGAKLPSCVEIVRNYEAAFKKAGGKLEWHDGGYNVASLSMPTGKSQRWMNLSIFNGQTGYSLEIVEVAAMEQKVEVNASEMLDALNRDGFIALYGILFDTGKDALKPESEPLLGEIVTLLKNNAGLKLSVEGHTDNVGNPKANLALSQKRAESVKKFLVGKGLDGKRLETKGWGDGKPMSDNRTEPGRAKNRRVELVKK